jgi:hypothetical protein
MDRLAAFGVSPEENQSVRRGNQFAIQLQPGALTIPRVLCPQMTQIFFCVNLRNLRTKPPVTSPD